MGTFLNAYCEKCGFTQVGIMYGSGFANRVPKIPALKKDTGELVVVEKSDDPNLRFYHQKEMYAGYIEGYGIQNADVLLNPANNLCPGCGEYSMEFVDVGNWD